MLAVYLSIGKMLELTHFVGAPRTAGQNSLASGHTEVGKEVDNDGSGSDSDGAEGYVARLVKILPAETAVVYAGISANIIQGSDDEPGHIFAFFACIFVTAAFRAPILFLPGERKQVGAFLFSILVCALWVYSMGSYLFDFGPRDDKFAWGIMLLLGAIFPAIYKGNPFSGIVKTN